MSVSISEEAVEAAAIAIDAHWSDDDNRGPSFSETERSYQDHCRSTARAALLAASSLRGDGANVLVPREPTPEIISAIRDAVRDEETNSLDGMAAYIYRAMIAAAPPPNHFGGKLICDALGFDPTNHHNAAKCPYCAPASPPLVTEGETVRAALQAIVDDCLNVASASYIKEHLLSQAMAALSNTPHKEGLRADPLGWLVVRDADPTFPRFYRYEHDADAMVAEVTVGPLARKIAIAALTPGAQNGR